MGNFAHLLFRDLRGADIHVAVDLHGISADNLSAYPFGKTDGQVGLSHGRRACNND